MKLCVFLFIFYLHFAFIPSKKEEIKDKSNVYYLSAAMRKVCF